MLCKYRHIFGKEREGVHSLRLFDIAIVDLGLTALAAKYIANHWNQPFWKVFVYSLIIGTLAHKLFCVETTLTNLVFFSSKA